LDLLAAASTSKVVMDHASSRSICRLVEEEAPRQSPAVPLTSFSPNKIGLSGLPN
jgi:hypothetical protein